MPTSRHPQKRCSSSPGLPRPRPLVAQGDPPRRHTPRPATHPARPHHRLVMLATRRPSQCTTFASQATNATVVVGAGYIQTVDAGHYQDPDPWRTVMDIFNRSRKQVRRWLNDYPDLTLHRQLSQDEAINEMKAFSVYLNRGPNKTTPIMSACKSEEGA